MSNNFKKKQNNNINNKIATRGKIGIKQCITHVSIYSCSSTMRNKKYLHRNMTTKNDKIVDLYRIQGFYAHWLFSRNA